jgi:hypothetical protein
VSSVDLEEHKELSTRFPGMIYEDSYSRMEKVVSLYRTVPAYEKHWWWRLLGREWTSSDNVSRYGRFLTFRFLGAPKKRLHMMDREDREAYNSLPEVLTIYRGCYEINSMLGMSWTLDRDTAITFPFLNRYRRQGEQPLLLSCKVQKSDVVYLGGRNEQEIIRTFRTPCQDSEQEVIDPIEGKEALGRWVEAKDAREEEMLRKLRKEASK